MTDREANIARFEAEMNKVKRPGVDVLMDYIRKSDFYAAPASTKYHLCIKGGLLQHSLNVLDALRGILTRNAETGDYEYRIAGKTVDSVPEASVIVMALLHDICKTYFYAESTRNVKNEKTGKWEKVPFFTVKDRMPLGHGAKSAMIIKQYMELTNRELYAIWWHMGFSGGMDDNSVGGSITLYPIVLALQTADMAAARIMEREDKNSNYFLAPAKNAARATPEDLPDFEDAPPLEAET